MNPNHMDQTESKTPGLQQKYSNKSRLLISVCMGALVSGIALIAAWQELGRSISFRHEQFRTSSLQREISAAVDQYKEENGTYPIQLADLLPNEKAGYTLELVAGKGIVDGWGRPFNYTFTSNDYAIISLGHDGKPGGKGVDYDLIDRTPRPPEATPTLPQFLFVLPTTGILLSCLLSGVLTSIICARSITVEKLNRTSLKRLIVSLTVTVVGAVFIALCLAAIHISSSH